MSWRDTAFSWRGYLRGFLSSSAATVAPTSTLVGGVLPWGAKVTFTGSWLPSTDTSDPGDPLHKDTLDRHWPPPPPSNPNTFSLQFKITAQNDEYIELEFTMGTYQLDNGDGHAPYSDKMQVLTICRKPCDTSTHFKNIHIVSAHGETEFGSFTSFGYLDTRPKEGGVLTLVRRYIVDSDWRSSANIRNYTKNYNMYAIASFMCDPEDVASTDCGKVRSASDS